MGFLSVVHSDRGIKKNTNQDSVLIKEASTDYGDVMLAVVCDGMVTTTGGTDLSRIEWYKQIVEKSADDTAQTIDGGILC